MRLPKAATYKSLVNINQVNATAVSTRMDGIKKNTRNHFCCVAQSTTTTIGKLCFERTLNNASYIPSQQKHNRPQSPMWRNRTTEVGLGSEEQETLPSSCDVDLRRIDSHFGKVRSGLLVTDRHAVTTKIASLPKHALWMLQRMVVHMSKIETVVSHEHKKSFKCLFLLSLNTN